VAASVGLWCMSHNAVRGVDRHLVHHDLLGCRLLMVLVSGEAQQVLLVWQRQRRRVANFAIELAPL